MALVDITQKPTSPVLAGNETVFIVKDGKLMQVAMPVLLAELIDARKVVDKDGKEIVYPSAGDLLRTMYTKLDNADFDMDFTDLDIKINPDTGMLHVYDTKNETFLGDGWYPTGSGTGDTGSSLTFGIQSAMAFSVAENATEAWINFVFRSIDTATSTPTGNGTLQIYVGGTLKRTTPIEQGEKAVDVRSFLSNGSNTVKLVLTDAYGKSATRNLTISVETLKLEWSLGNTAIAEGTLQFTLKPTGNYTKTVYILVDGEEYEQFEVATSGFGQTKTISAQPHGSHIVSAYCTMDVNGDLMPSETLTCAVAWQDGASTTPIIAVDTLETEVKQYTTVNIVHRVVDPQNNPTAVEYLVNGETFKSDEIDQSEQTWSYRLAQQGETTLAIKCGNEVYPVVFNVTDIGVTVTEITDGLKVKVEPTEIANLREWNYDGYTMTLSDNFDEINGGLVNDENGDRCIRITAGDRLTLNYPLFSGDPRKNGLAFKMVYMVKNSSNKQTSAISCMSSGIGLEIFANNAYLHGNQTTCDLSTCEDEKTELDVNIKPDSGDTIMYMWEKASTFSYMKYAAEESFGHTVQQGITFGSDDADVYLYLLRAYGRDLTDDEIKANFIADGADTEEILARKDRNDIYDNGAIDVDKAATKNPDCHFIVINAERMTAGKSDGVPGTIRHIYKAGGAEHQFTANVTMYVQGTSSVEHAGTAGPNINFYFPDGITLEDGTVVADGYAMNGRDKSIPVKEITYKKNIASEDHIVNRATAEWYNRFQPSIRKARQENALVRDCLDSTMCAVLFTNSGTSAVQVGPDLVPPGGTIFFGLGNICSNKDSVEAFAYDPIVIEVKNNTEDQVRFKSTDLTGNNWKVNYDFRYLDESKYTEDEAKAKWQIVQDFLYAVDCTAYTDELLPSAVTINGVTYAYDSYEYRKAKWKAEAPQIFDMQTLYFHHNITLFLLLRDNRAKNMFWSYNEETGKWGLWFNWDNDTGLCRNNDGYIDIEPGYMDWDTYGTGDVFNGADNVLFVNIREWDLDELTANYFACETAGAWNIDEFYRFCKESQEYICESLWIEDAQHNAIRTMQNLGTYDYLERATGRLRLHLKKALTFQKVLVDGYFNSSDATLKSASFRGYTPTDWAGVAPSGLVTITTYTNMYINVLAGSTPYKVRAYAGVPVQIDLSANLNNTEMYFRQAEWIQDFGDLSGLYLGQFEASNLKRVRRLLIGSSVDGYYNTNFTQAGFANCVKLEELNMGGLQNAKRAFDFTPNIYLKKLYTKGSGITGLTFAKKGRLQEAKINAVSSLTMDTLYQLETFEMESYEGLTALTVVDCPTVDSFAMVNAATGLARIRLIDVDWVAANAETFLRLRNCGGKDDSGYDIDDPVLTGNAHIAALSQTKLDILLEAFPDLAIVYDEITKEWTLRFWNEDKTVVLDEQLVEHGYGGENPVTREENPIEQPSKEPTEYIVYRFAGWSGSYSTIIQDTDVVAVFSSNTRYYTVVWLNGLVKVQEKSVAAGESAAYEGGDLTKTGFIWTGWDALATDVLSDMTINATFEAPALPTEKLDTTQFDFIYSDDPNDSMAYTFGQFVGIITSGLAGEYFNMYDKIKILNTWDGIKDEGMILSLHSLGHFEMADDSGELAKTTWFMEGLLTAGRQWNPTNTNVGGYLESAIDDWLENSLFPNLPSWWRAVINPVKVLANAGDQSITISEGVRHLYLPAYCELGFGTTEVPYKNEVCAAANEIQFSKYTGNAQRIKKTFYNEGTAQNYWTRTAHSGSSTYAMNIYSNGGSNIYVANFTFWVCVGLSISKIN